MKRKMHNLQFANEINRTNKHYYTGTMSDKLKKTAYVCKMQVYMPLCSMKVPRYIYTQYIRAFSEAPGSVHVAA